jgi:predicted dehydrogenase
VEDHFWSEILFVNGVSALIEASNNHRIPQPRWCIVGTEGTLWVQGGSPTAWSPAIIRRTSGGTIEEIRHELPQVELAKGFYRELARALRAGEPPPVQPTEVLRVMKVIEAVRRSSDSGKTTILS